LRRAFFLAAAAFIAKPSRFLNVTDKFHSQVLQPDSTGRFWKQVLEAELHGRAFYLSGKGSVSGISRFIALRAAYSEFYCGE
jgi:hypothetical protein